MKLNGLKALQRKALRASKTTIPLAATRRHTTLWKVECSGSCGRDGCEWHYVRRADSEFRCDCPAGANRHACYHILGVWRYEVEGKGRLPSFWLDRATARRTKRHPVTFGANGVTVYATLRNGGVKEAPLAFLDRCRHAYECATGGAMCSRCHDPAVAQQIA